MRILSSVLLFCEFLLGLNVSFTTGFHLGSRSTPAVQLQDNSNLEIKEDFTLLVSGVFSK